MSRASDALRRCFLTAGLSDSALETLANLTQRRQIAAGAIVFVEGERGSELFIVDSGEVRITTTSPTGQVLTLASLYPGDSFGGFALLDGEPRSATATAIADSTLVALHRDAFLDTVHTNPTACDAVLHSLAEMVRSMNKRLLDDQTDPPARVAKVLLAHVERHGVPGERSGVMIKHPLSIDDIASMADLFASQVDKVLEKYQYESVVERGPEYWTVLRMDALSEATKSPMHRTD
ncbi:MAG: Crp/Fnr family transcriptional regulator [Ardenticatenales bacterium]|nr:Crp/Fnr family transcriptional regulator [Ardenticatenales bacterium]